MNNTLGKDIEISISGVRHLIDRVKKVHGFDLGCFALTSFKRRLIKALKKNELNDIETFTDKIVSEKLFFNKFLNDIDVECTEFFRDPAFWRYLRDEVLPLLDKKNMRIKIWVPSCSSGEEVITTAITVQEAGLKDKTEILATDISPYIIQDFEKKVYSKSKFEISETNYQRFNEEKTDFSRYTKPVKNGFCFPDDFFENIKVDYYNYQDAKKIKSFNLIICRNIFIYYTAQYQEMLLNLFLENLSYNGYLAIGNMENISWCKDFHKFVEVNESEKVYKKIN